MKRIYTICFLCFLFAMTAIAQQHSFQSQWKGKEHVTLDFDIVIPDSLKSSKYAVWVMPFAYNGKGDTLTLAPVVFRGKKNQKLVDRARYFDEQPEAGYEELTLNDTLPYNTVLSTVGAPWLLKSRIDVAAKIEKEGCCNLYSLPQKHIGHFAYVPPFVPQYIPVKDNTGKAGELQKENPVLEHISKYRPYDSTRILRKEKDMLYVNFPLDKIVLKEDFRDNKRILDKIVSLTRDIMADTTSTVKLIQVIGMASVEGSIRHNVWLADSRAKALKKYVQERIFVPDSLFELCNGGEGWSELRDQINDTTFVGRDELLEIIDHTPDANLRERKMKQLMGGKPYKYLKDNILQDQRNSGYLRIYYDYVPDNNAKIINKASELIRQEKYKEALPMLQKVRQDSRSWNALGVALFMVGHEEEAVHILRKAAATGNTEAQRNLRQYEAIKKAEKMAK